ncbi:MAG: hypothetical protein GY909_13740 [Oligoflexia bacterium]|nr:hypothetical protein [Oligoflexia bacterium]
MKLFLSIIFLLFSLSIRPCAEVNLQTQENSPLQKIPVYDQDGLGTCYSYAASVLMDYHLIESGKVEDQLTNPLWLALKYSQDTHDKSLEGGNMRLTINEIRKIGICKSSVIEEALDRVKRENDISHAQLLDIVELTHDIYAKDPSLSTSEIYDQAINQCHAKNRNIGSSMHDDIFGGFQTPEGLFTQVMPTYFLSDLLKECKGDNIYKPKVPKAKSVCGSCSDEKMKKKVDDLLSEGKPVGVRYCASVLKDGDYQGINEERNGLFFSNRSDKIVRKKDEEDENGNTLLGCRHHASVVVGSRNNGGKCEYLLRNSWGGKKYKEHTSCLCEVSKGVYEECTRGDGKPNAVGCWIRADQLVSNTYELAHMKDK